MSLITELFSTENRFFRNAIAFIVIFLSIGGILWLAILYFKNSGNNAEAAKDIFNTVLPVFATWIGTVLAFYFGKENFEAASKRYERIIDQMTPDILDDVSVQQIMISRKTMVSLDEAKAKEKSVDELIQFLESVDKSRLPVFAGNKIKYIIHKSTLLEASRNKKDDALSFEKFVEAKKDTITLFIKSKASDILEEVMAKINTRPSVKDVFIVDDSDNVLGWLTDTLIMRYLK